MNECSDIQVGSYQLAGDRYYDRETHLWVQPLEGGRVRCGFDPLGTETSGDIVAVAFEPVGTTLERGSSFGSLEAAKFVGPLTLPVSGTIVSHNAEVLADPGRMQRAPFESWLVELELSEPAERSADLLRDPERVRAWFAEEVERFRSQGVLAE